MSAIIRPTLSDIPLRNLKVDTKAGEALRQKVTDGAGEVLDQARKAANLEVKQMAGDMGVSESLVHRGLKNQEQLSFHRLWELPDAFWAELIVAIAKRRRVAVVKTTIELSSERKKAV